MLLHRRTADGPLVPGRCALGQGVLLRRVRGRAADEGLSVTSRMGENSRIALPATRENASAPQGGSSMGRFACR